ncbi:MAG: NifU N-terminal domain-containing protein [Longimicrobiales bacterium]
MAETRVRYQATPNPNAGKFTVNRPVVEGTASRSYHSAADASAHPVAQALFRIDGVSSLFMVEDFITVTKLADAQWTDLVPRVVAAIEQTME